MLSVRVGDVLMRNLKRHAKESGQTIQKIVEDALEEEFGEVKFDKEKLKRWIEEANNTSPEERARSRAELQDLMDGKEVELPDYLIPKIGPRPTDEEIAAMQERTRAALEIEPMSETIIKERNS